MRPRPFADHAVAYFEAGWTPLPITAGIAKDPPPAGWTGSSPNVLHRRQVDAWVQQYPGSNIALRLPRDVVGIDVDQYGDKRGGDELAELEARLGKLPPTVSSTARGWGPSRIRYYRVPEGTRLRGSLAGSIEAVQHGHRYALVAPSVHPGLCAPYRWYDDVGDVMEHRVPTPDELPDLPWAWIDEFRSVGDGRNAIAAAPAQVDEFLTEHCAGARPEMLKGLRRQLDKRGARHDRLVRVAVMAAEEAAAGWYPMAAAVDMLHDWWLRVMDDLRRLGGPEFDDAIAWGVAQVLADPNSETIRRKRAEAERAREVRSTTGMSPMGDIPAEPRGSVPEGRGLPVEFFEARPVLAHIRQAAHARGLSADAVLAVVLARLAAFTSPSVRIPGDVGTDRSLSTYVALVGASGTGKSSAKEAGRRLLPTELATVRDDLPLGSGEGLVEAYYGTVPADDGKGKTERRRIYDGAFVYLDEGEALTELGGRKGSTLLPTLRSMWGGETAGETNATAERRRVLAAGSYALGFVVGFQPALARQLLADEAAGTPQRFLFASSTDPSIPEHPPPDPGPIDWTPPAVIEMAGRKQPQYLKLDDTIVRQVRAERLPVARGEITLDPMASHRTLARLKVAGLLAVLDGRLDVNADDWRLAGDVIDASARQLAVLQADVRYDERRREQAQTERHVRRERAVEDDLSSRVLDRMARAIARRVHRLGGELPVTRTAMQAVAGRDRAVVPIVEAVEHASARGWIVVDGDTMTPGTERPT